MSDVTLESKLCYSNNENKNLRSYDIDIDWNEVIGNTSVVTTNVEYLPEVGEEGVIYVVRHDRTEDEKKEKLYKMIMNIINDNDDEEIKKTNIFNTALNIINGYSVYVYSKDTGYEEI